MRFLSPEWLDALAAAARTVTVPAGVSLTVEQVVVGPGSEVRYHVVLDGGRAAVVRGPALAADVTLRAPYEVAASLSKGELNVQRALSAGAMRVGGRLEALHRHGRVLAGLDDAFAAVRALTTY